MSDQLLETNPELLAEASLVPFNIDYLYRQISQTDESACPEAADRIINGQCSLVPVREHRGHAND
jgi:hypothetical protein